jgi:hypothetical protein
MSFLIIVLGIAAFVYLALSRRRPIKLQRERHDVIKLPGGGIHHDPECRVNECRQRRVKR